MSFEYCCNNTLDWEYSITHNSDFDAAKNEILFKILLKLPETD